MYLKSRHGGYENVAVGVAVRFPVVSAVVVHRVTPPTAARRAGTSPPRTSCVVATGTAHCVRRR